MEALIYFAMCILVGLVGIGHRGGFLFYFSLSLFLSPLVGILLLVVLTRAPRKASSA